MGRSKHKAKQNRVENQPANRPLPLGRRRPRRAIFLAAIVVVGGIVWIELSGGESSKPAPDNAAKTTEAAPATPPAPKTAASETPAASASPAATTTGPAPEVRKLQGKWRRPDGDYLLTVRRVESDGKVQAEYNNPQPIRVSKAEASQEKGLLKLFVELRDTGYPGCTYKLLYNPKEDVLVGEYFQAAQQQAYEVGFVRLPD